MSLRSTFAFSVFAAVLGGPATAAVEPGAGSWKTLGISSGRDYRVGPPPDEAGTRREVEWLKGFAGERDPRVEQQIRYWNAGAPSYRWVDLMVKRQNAGEPMTAFPHRVFTYVTMAMHDATVAAWESKYHYQRSRPSRMDPAVPVRVEVPDSPSYPSDYAAAAGAAAAVLSAMIPGEAASFQALAEEAGRSRMLAGVEYPSDYVAGMELGRRVAEQVLVRARADGSDAVFTGAIPTGPCMWTGTNPANATMGNWRPILLSSGSEFRSAAPPSCQSGVIRGEAEMVKAYPRTFATNAKAFYYQTPEGVWTDFHVAMSRYLFEDNMGQNAPRAARAYAMLAAITYDTWIASNDSKYAYWYLRPHMLDPGISPLFPAPNFPSYPSNHSALSTARTELMAYLFPDRAAALAAWGKEAGDSRIWAGIHFEVDNQAGVEMGRAIARKHIGWLESR